MSFTKDMQWLVEMFTSSYITYVGKYIFLFYISKVFIDERQSIVATSMRSESVFQKRQKHDLIPIRLLKKNAFTQSSFK